MLTDGAATSATGTAPVFSSASYNFVSGDVGAKVFIASGTNWIPGWYTIASVGSNKATLNATAGQAVLAPIASGGLSTTNGCATTASPTTATWTIDYSQQAAAQFTYTDLVIGATTTNLTSVGNPFGKQQVGNLIQITSGTNFTVGWYCIASVSTVTATMDRSVGTAAASSGHGRQGGAFATLTANLFLSSASLALGGHLVWMTGTQTITATIPITIANSAPGGSGYALHGYGTYRGDGTHAVIACATNSVHLMTIEQVYAFGVRWVDLTCTAGTPGDCVRATSNVSYSINFQNCHLSGGENGFNIPYVTEYTFAPLYLVEVEISSCVVYGIITGAAVVLLGCYIYDNGSDGIYSDQATTNLQPSITAIGTVFSTNTGNGANVQGLAQSGTAVFFGCAFYKNGADGCRIVAQNLNDGIQAMTFLNCVFYGNTGYGINPQSIAAAGVTPSSNIQRNNAFGSNTSGNRPTGAPSDPTDIALSGDPFTAGSSGNFTLNTTAGAGAACTGAGWQSSIL